MTPHTFTFNVWYEVDPAKSPGYKKMLEVKVAPDRKSHFGLEVVAVREKTLFGLEDAPHLLDDMTTRPLFWEKTYHELKDNLRLANV